MSKLCNLESTRIKYSDPPPYKSFGTYGDLFCNLINFILLCLLLSVVSIMGLQLCMVIVSLALYLSILLSYFLATVLQILFLFAESKVY